MTDMDRSEYGIDQTEYPAGPDHVIVVYQPPDLGAEIDPREPHGLDRGRRTGTRGARAPAPLDDHHARSATPAPPSATTAAATRRRSRSPSCTSAGPAFPADPRALRYRAPVTTRSSDRGPDRRRPRSSGRRPADVARALADGPLPRLARRDREASTFASYDDAWRWSVDEPGAFWRIDLGPLRGDRPPPAARQTSSTPTDAAARRWFPGATLNYAEHALRLPGRAGRRRRGRRAVADARRHST